MLSSPQSWKHFVSLLSNPARRTPDKAPVFVASTGELQEALVQLQAISRVCMQDKQIHT